jgi:ABC-type oligopeptide transport system substrate-binding subunit
MKGTRLLGALLAVSSIALLVVAASTAAPSAKRGGTFVLDISTDVDYIDPQLSYYALTRSSRTTGRRGSSRRRPPAS